MEHLDSLIQAQPDRPTCLTIGAFDGVHRGHQRVLERLVATTRSNGFRAAVLTFFPLPRQVVGARRPRFYLTTPDERARLLQQKGIELVITHPFDERVRATRAADFVDMLVAHLDVKEIWVGPDFALGYKREGDVPFLRVQGETKGFVIRTVDFFAVDGAVASSSLIRMALSEGRVEDAGRCLGRPFRLPGRVVPDDSPGRSAGLDPAYLEIWEEHALPAQGVYAARAWMSDACVPAVVDVAMKPRALIAVRLLDCEGEIAGQEMALDFVGRLGDELERATAQIEQDMADARRLYGEV